MNYHTILTYLMIGIGGTAVLDIWALMLTKLFGIPATNWNMVGRWIGHMKSGQFIQTNLLKAEKIPYEGAIGWLAHYLIGMGYGLILCLIGNTTWLEYPTLLSPLIIAWLALAAPFFIMMPGMGAGIAGAKLPAPLIARVKSLMGHTIFAIGMYFSGLFLAVGF